VTGLPDIKFISLPRVKGDFNTILSPLTVGRKWVINRHVSRPLERVAKFILARVLVAGAGDATIET